MVQLPPNTKPQFSGHETFPLRQLWLRKAYEAVATAAPGYAKTTFMDDRAIARFGVGRNMVMSMRFWAIACGVISEDAGLGFVPTELGRLVFDAEKGLDTYCERPASTWLMHWILASTPDKTTSWYYVFNHISQQVFDRDGIVDSLSGLIAEHGLRISLATLKRDVECCIRSYVPRISGDSPEEISEPLLGELGLIQQNSKGSFEFRRGAKRSLPDGVFAYALLDYWRRLEHEGAVMAFDRVAHDFGSPGRVFKLDESAVADRLMALESLSGGQIIWTEQAGIRQVTRTGQALTNIESSMMKLLKAAYAKK
jgi:hypothetical protein